jgi:GT2 family glycosyltransferase
MSKVAVVILSWNGKSLLEAYLPSVLRYSGGADIVVVDNASSDGTVEMLAKIFPGTRVIALEDNFGYAAGYNRALKQVEAEYFVLLNQDVEVTDGWLEPLVGYMDAHPDVGACQPKIRDARRRDHFEYAGAAGGFLDGLAYPYCRGRVFDTIEQDVGQYDETMACAWASGAALMVRRELYNAFGGLDADFIAHMEEIDLCWRFRNAGYAVVCCPGSVVYHVGGASLAYGNPRKTFLNFRNNFVMLIKNESGVRLLYKIPCRWSLDVVAAVRFLLAGKLSHWWAVFRSHLQVIFRFGKWWRKHVSAKRTAMHLRVAAPNRQGVTRGSVVWRYFARGRKTFTSLVRQR